MSSQGGYSRLSGFAEMSMIHLCTASALGKKTYFPTKQPPARTELMIVRDNAALSHDISQFGRDFRSRSIRAASASSSRVVKVDGPPFDEARVALAVQLSDWTVWPAASVTIVVGSPSGTSGIAVEGANCSLGVDVAAAGEEELQHPQLAGPGSTVQRQLARLRIWSREGALRSV